MKKAGKTVTISNFVEYIKKLGGTAGKNGRLNFPESLGNGYLRVVRLTPQLSIMIQHFKVNKTMTVRRKDTSDNKDTLIFSFRNILNHQTTIALKSDFSLLPSVQVSTFDVGVDINIPADAEITNLIIGIDIDFLKELLSEYRNNKLIKQMISRQQPYLYEEIISPKIQAIAAEIYQLDTAGILAHYFYRIKSEELVYYFLTELLKRDNVSAYPFNHDDINRIYATRNSIIHDLEIPPQLESLAQTANMSVTKLTRLFRQVFGDSIYNYYQRIRMQHAAALLRENKRSVSEVGYHLGFSNLSHFTRLFEKFMGTKPKKYSKGEINDNTLF